MNDSSSATASAAGRPRQPKARWHLRPRAVPRKIEGQGRPRQPITRRAATGAIGAILAAGGALAACAPGVGPAAGGAGGTGGTGGVGSEAGPDGTVSLQKMAWGSPLEKEAIEKGLDLFHQQQNKIRVEYIHTPDAYDDKLQALLASNTAPDVFKVAGNLYADYATSGALMDITDRLTKDALLGKADYFIQPFEQQRSTYQGKWYGIGSTAQEQLLFYNVDVLRQAGIAPPPVDAERAWTWSDFQQFARRLTVRPGDLAERLGAHWPTGTYGPAVVSNGGKIIDQQTLRFALDQPAAIEAVQRIADLTLKDRVAAVPAEQQGANDLQRMASGKYAMWVAGNWNLLDLAPLGLKFGVGVLPKLKRPATTMTSSSTSVWRGTKKPEASWQLFKFLNSDDYQLPLVQKGLWNPSHTSLLSTAGVKRWLQPNVHPEGYERLVADFMVKYGYADFPVVGVRKASTVLNEGLAQVWAGTAAAADVLKDAVARANNVLDEEQARVGK